MLKVVQRTLKFEKSICRYRSNNPRKVQAREGQGSTPGRRNLEMESSSARLVGQQKQVVGRHEADDGKSAQEYARQGNKVANFEIQLGTTTVGK